MNGRSRGQERATWEHPGGETGVKVQLGWREEGD